MLLGSRVNLILWKSHFGRTHPCILHLIDDRLARVILLLFSFYRRHLLKYGEDSPTRTYNKKARLAFSMDVGRLIHHHQGSFPPLAL